MKHLLTACVFCLSCYVPAQSNLAERLQQAQANAEQALSNSRANLTVTQHRGPAYYADFGEAARRDNPADQVSTGRWISLQGSILQEVSHDALLPNGDRGRCLESEVWNGRSGTQSTVLYGADGRVSSQVSEAASGATVMDLLHWAYRIHGMAPSELLARTGVTSHQDGDLLVINGTIDGNPFTASVDLAKGGLVTHSEFRTSNGWVRRVTISEASEIAGHWVPLVLTMAVAKLQGTGESPGESSEYRFTDWTFGSAAPGDMHVTRGIRGTVKVGENGAAYRYDAAGRQLLRPTRQPEEHPFAVWITVGSFALLVGAVTSKWLWSRGH